VTRDAQEQHLPRKGRRWVKVLAVLFACVLLWFLVVRPFVAELFKVSDEGMLPTFEEGDRVFVDKVIYRFREPERQDVIVFNSLVRGTDRVMIMRVVGVPGDTVGVRDGVLFVNGERIEEPYVNKRFPDDSNYPPDAPYITIPPGEIFVMGDNRTNSRDSRYFGPISMEKVEGEAFVVFWPPSNVGIL
jgi:signal peptidase I